MGRLYLYAVDPGAFSVMEPIWITAKNAGVDVQWIASGIAAGRLRERKLSFHRDIFRVIDKSLAEDNVLVGARMDPQENIRAFRYANQRNVPIHFLFDHWCYYRENFLSRGKLVLPNGYVFAIDQFEKRLLVQNSIPVDKIKVVGHAAMAETQRRWSVRNKTAILPKRVLFLSEPIGLDFGMDTAGRPALGFDEAAALRLLAETLARKYPNRYEILVKTHPREDHNDLSRRVGAFAGVKIRFSGDGDPIKMIFDSRFVFGMTTVLLLHAMQVGKVVGSIQPQRTQRGRENSNAHLERVLIKNDTDIVRLMKTKRTSLLKLPTDPAKAVLRHLGIAA